MINRIKLVLAAVLFIAIISIQSAKAQVYAAPGAYNNPHSGGLVSNQVATYGPYGTSQFSSHIIGGQQVVRTGGYGFTQVRIGGFIQAVPMMNVRIGFPAYPRMEFRVIRGYRCEGYCQQGRFVIVRVLRRECPPVVIVNRGDYVDNSAQGGWDVHLPFFHAGGSFGD